MTKTQKKQDKYNKRMAAKKAIASNKVEEKKTKTIKAAGLSITMNPTSEQVLDEIVAMSKQNKKVKFSVTLNPTEEQLQKVIDESPISRGIYFGSDMLLNFGGPIESIQWGDDYKGSKCWRWHLLHADDITIPVFLNSDLNDDGTINLYKSSGYGTAKFSLEDAIKIVATCHLNWLGGMRHDDRGSMMKAFSFGAMNILQGIDACVKLDEHNEVIVPQLYNEVCEIKNGYSIID